MKILLPFQDPYGRPLDHPIVSGGTEMFCKLIYENFDVEVLQLEDKDTLSKKGLYSRKTTDEQQKSILEKAEQCNADIIINNFAWSSFCGSIVSQSHVPVMNIEHCFYPFLSIVNKWHNLLKNGHSLFLVSNLQKKYYDGMNERIGKMNKKIGKRPLPINLLNPSFCKTKPEILDIEYDCGTIGRCDKEKNPFKLKDMTKDTDFRTLVISSKSSNTDKQGQYYEKNKNWSDTIWDKHHDEVVKNISKCGTFFSTWNRETWGITALEALSCGVPVILNSNKNGDHASEIIPASENHYKKIPTNDKEALANAIKSFKNIDRKEIQEMTLEKHSLKSWKKQMLDCMSYTIDNFKSKTSNLKKFIN